MLYKYTINILCNIMTCTTSRTYARCGVRSVLSFIFVRIVCVIIVRVFIVLFTLSLDFLHFGSLILKPYLYYSHTQTCVFSQRFSYLNIKYDITVTYSVYTARCAIVLSKSTHYFKNY